MAPVSDFVTRSQEYDRGYSLYLTKSERLSATVKWLDGNIGKLLAEVRSSQKNPAEFSVLSVGCYRGELDLIILEHLDRLLGDQAAGRYSAIEPLGAALNKFEKDARETFPRVAFTKHEMTFQRFCEKNSDQNCFDFVHFLSSLYFCKAEEALVHCYNNRLRENGAIFCIIGDAESQLYQEVARYHGPANPTQESGYELYTVQDLARIAQKHGWRYEAIKYQYRVDVTECFDENSEEGNLLLDFMLHSSKVRESCGEEGKKRIQHLLENCTFTDEDSKRMLLDTIGVMIIHK